MSVVWGGHCIQVDFYFAEPLPDLWRSWLTRSVQRIEESWVQVPPEFCIFFAIFPIYFVYLSTHLCLWTEGFPFRKFMLLSRSLDRCYFNDFWVNYHHGRLGRSINKCESNMGHLKNFGQSRRVRLARWLPQRAQRGAEKTKGKMCQAFVHSNVIMI